MIFSNIKLVNKKCNILMKEYMKKEEKKVICFLYVNNIHNDYEDYLHYYQNGGNNVSIKFENDNNEDDDTICFDDINDYFYNVTTVCLEIYRKIKDCISTKTCLSKNFFKHGIEKIPCGCEYKRIEIESNIEKIYKYFNENIENININHLVINFSYYYYEYPYNKILKRMIHECLQKLLDLLYNKYNIYITELHNDVNYHNDEEDDNRNIMNEIITTLLNKTKYKLILYIDIVSLNQKNYNIYYEMFKEIEFTNNSINILEITFLCHWVF